MIDFKKNIKINWSVGFNKNCILQINKEILIFTNVIFTILLQKTSD